MTLWASSFLQCQQHPRRSGSCRAERVRQSKDALRFVLKSPQTKRDFPGTAMGVCPVQTIYIILGCNIWILIEYIEMH
jgi:hypothetical protein